VPAIAALALGIVAIVVAGGGDDERGVARAHGPVETMAVELGDLFVRPSRIEIPSGTHLMVEVTNHGDLAHDLNLNGEIGTDRLQPGESETADFGDIHDEVQAWCTVPGHREAGMELTIAVTEPPPNHPTTITSR
jgi:nitrite reductase (NO-forming)